MSKIVGIDLGTTNSVVAVMEGVVRDNSESVRGGEGGQVGLGIGVGPEVLWPGQG